MPEIRFSIKGSWPFTQRYLHKGVIANFAVWFRVCGAGFKVEGESLVGFRVGLGS